MFVGPANFTVRGKHISRMAQYNRLCLGATSAGMLTQDDQSSQSYAETVWLLDLLLLLLYSCFISFSHQSGFDINITNICHGGACSTKGVDKLCTQVFVGKPEGKRSLGRSRCRWENNIKID